MCTTTNNKKLQFEDKEKTNNEEAIIKKEVVSTSINIKTTEIRSDGDHYQHILLLGTIMEKICVSPIRWRMPY